MVEVTRILQEVQAGQAGATERLAEVLYEELRSIARRELGAERVAHTLQPTALVNEAWLRLIGNDGAAFQNRAHFFAAAANAIRRVLADHARRRLRIKRGGEHQRVPIDDLEVAAPMRDEQLLALDEALERLATFAPVQARVVELRFFAGMTTSEVARALDSSESTVERHWRSARAWLRAELGEPDGF